jgi:Ni/Fe-hydrogenase subunit HybB-like protein
MHDVTNYVFPNDLHLHWSMMIALYPYITGIVAGAFIISSLYHVFGVSQLKPISRYALLFALAFLAFATAPLLLHLGHTERCFNMLFTPNSSSAMSGFGYIYNAYAILLILEILFIYRPVLYDLKLKSQGLMKKMYTVLTFGSDNFTSKALALDHKIISFLAAVGIPMACVLHGYVGFIFGGVKANPIWSTPLMPVIFLLSACVSGIAGIVLSYVLIKTVRKHKIDMVCLRTSIKYLAGFIIIDFGFEMLEMFAHSYLKTEHHHMVAQLWSGPLFNSFWVGQVFLFSVIPILLMGWMILSKMNDGMFKFLACISSILLLLQVAFMRWNIVIGGQLLSKSSRGFSYYHAEWLGKEGILMALIILCAPILLLYVLSKIFPFWIEDEKNEPITVKT